MNGLRWYIQRLQACSEMDAMIPAIIESIAVMVLWFVANHVLEAIKVCLFKSGKSFMRGLESDIHGALHEYQLKETNGRLVDLFFRHLS